MNPNKDSEEEFWDEKLLSESRDSKMPSESMDDPQRISDDFLFMDVSFEDDFQGLLDASPTNDLEGNECIKTTQESLTQDAGRSKRSQEGDSLSPPKKRRSIHCISPNSGLVDLDVSCASFMHLISSSEEELEDIEAQYMYALHHLALSMRRSEVTRNEILRFRKEAEAHAQLELAEYRTFSNAEYFLQGYRSTLTVGLDQSRQMLQGLLGKGHTL
jgi:hypothetical protein